MKIDRGPMDAKNPILELETMGASTISPLLGLRTSASYSMSNETDPVSRIFPSLILPILMTEIMYPEDEHVPSTLLYR